MKKIKTYAKQARVKHWIKNGLLFAPLTFAYQFFDPKLVLMVVAGFFSFSLLASSIYILNDWCDLEKDREHPTKKNRPLASGAISIRSGAIFGAVLFLVSMGIAYFLPIGFQLSLGLYGIMNLGYSFWFKHIVAVDIIMVALMYLLRIYAGAAVISVTASSWIVLTTFSLALFMIVGKRYAERISIVEGENTRAILTQYPKEMLELFMGVALTLTLVFYSQFAIDKSNFFALTIPVVMFGLFRYAFLVFYHKQGQEPEKVIFDPIVLGTAIFWFVMSVIILVAREGGMFF